MRVAGRAISGIGDFVPGSFPIPSVGMGDFVKGRFAVPQTPVGMGDCSCGGSCGPCKSRGTNGLGQVADYSLTGTGIGTDIYSGTGFDTFQTWPNYIFYGAAALIAYMAFFETNATTRYRRR